jgi:RNA polymerase sigma-70 factor (ECF subfamily)
MKYTEELLLNRLKAGEETAWKQVFSDHWLSMCYLAVQYLSDEQLARGVASDVMSHLWEIRDSLNIKQSLRAYLLQATRHRCLNLLSSKTARSESESLSIDGYLHAEMTDTAHPLNRLLEKELEGSVNRLVENLPPQTRKVFLKSRMEGLTYNQISDELGISINTVRYHMKLAFSILREKIGNLLWFFLLFFLHH